MIDASPAGALKRTRLYDIHVSLGAKMVPFAGYEMPVQYPLGVLKEHLWTREKCGLFDVSHMGQATLVAEDGRHETVAAALEALVPADILNLQPGQQRYSQLLADDGGIIDDLMVTRPRDSGSGCLFVVVNAGCKDGDYAHIRSRLPNGVRLEILSDRALLALQGPDAWTTLQRAIPQIDTLQFMSILSPRAFGGPYGHLSNVSSDTTLRGSAIVTIGRSGYTGEDGFEISLSDEDAAYVWQCLIRDARVQPIGLGARDSLRLEAGLCLYGHDIDTTTSPIEAGLAWSIQKRRRIEGGFPGAARIQRELKDGPSRLRIGIKPEGRAPAREGTEIFSDRGDKIGVVTSGGFGPSVNGPIAMGYVASAHAPVGTRLNLMVRGKALPATVVAMPFQPHRYRRG
jgi:aminomethyltransferase